MRAQDYALGCYVDGISEVLVVRQWVPNLISLKLFSLLVSTYLLAAVVCVCVCVCLGQTHSLCILVRLTPCVFRSDFLPVSFGQTHSLYLFVILAPRVFWFRLAPCVLRSDLVRLTPCVFRSEYPY